MPLPSTDFDPTEAAVPWQIFVAAGHSVIFATPNGKAACADERMLTGKGLGLLRGLLMAHSNAVKKYQARSVDAKFTAPLSYDQARLGKFDAIFLPGGHAAGMKIYLESPILQQLIGEAFANKVKVAAICHGVVLAARSIAQNGKSVLFGRKTTALLKSQELTAWAITCAWLGSYYRTYPVTVEDEVRASLANPVDFLSRPTTFVARFRGQPGSRIYRPG